MASAHIEIGISASRTSAQTRSAIDQLQSVANQFAELKATFDQMALGNDWVTLGANLGVSAEQAETVYNLWGSANTELQSSPIVQVLARLG